MNYPITAAEALDKLTALKVEEQRVWNDQRETVAAARYHDCTWEEIAAALGTSRQAAWARWAD